MAHELHRLSKDLLEQPQLITEAKFKEIAEVLEDRNHGLYKMALDASKKPVDREKLNIENGVASINLQGALTYRPTLFGSLCGLTSYQTLLQQANAISKMEDVKVVLLNTDGPGGEAYRMMESAREFKQILNDSGKKVITYIDGMSASATYGFSIVADEVIINPDASAGSIGVVVRLTNTNKRDKEDGIETRYITAGASKVPFDKDGEYREDFISDIQERVDALYENFVEHVANMRGISPDVVRSTEAKVFSADKALELGLVDKVMEGSEFYEYLADLVDDTSDNVNGGARAANNHTGVKMSQETDTPVNEELAHEAAQDVETSIESVVEAATTEVTETLEKEEVEVEAAVEAPQVDMSAEIADLKAQLEAAMNAQNELAEMKAKAEADLLAKNKAELASQAGAWAFAEVDAEAFAESALSGSVPVEMFQTALNKAKASLEASDAMKELGATVENEPEAKEMADGVEAALAANSKIKFRK